jgi:hypothetical protein
MLESAWFEVDAANFGIARQESIITAIECFGTETWKFELAKT